MDRLAFVPPGSDGHQWRALVSALLRGWSSCPQGVLPGGQLVVRFLEGRVVLLESPQRLVSAAGVLRDPRLAERAQAPGADRWCSRPVPGTPAVCATGLLSPWGEGSGERNPSAGWLPRNGLAGPVGVGAIIWPTRASQTLRPLSWATWTPSLQGPLLTCRLPLPGTSQWPRPGAPGALSPSYDGGLHSLVSFPGWVDTVPHGHVWPGEGTVHVDLGPGEVGHEGSSACLLWPAYRAWKPCPRRAARAL